MNAAVQGMLLPEQPGKHLSMVLALLVHLLLAAFLVYGIHWQSSAPEAVEVELVRSLPAPQAAAVEPPPLPPAPEPKVEPAPAPEPLKPDIKLQQEKPKPAPKSPPVRNDDPLRELIKRDNEQQKTRDLAAALDREIAGAKASQAAVALNRARGAWGDKIAAKIKPQIVRGNATGNPEAIYEITLLPDGSVVGDPRLKKSTGNPALDDAIVRAILKSSPLPKPDDPNAFQRVLELRFRPLED